MNRINKLQKKIQSDFFNLRHEMERFSAQVKFAGRLKELFPAQAAKWSGLIDKAIRPVEELPEQCSRKQLTDAVRKAEAAMAPIAAFAKKYTVYCVSHAHIDMNWMWSWPETVAVTNDSFSTVLKLMEEYPDFIFSQSQASVYAIIEEYNPAMLEKIRERVREKRWEVTASHWVECDKNMVNGETLCRHLLYTRRYLKKIFNLDPEDVVIDWAPDTFGHAATVPSYLARGGVKYCYLHRPGELWAARPGAFWWKSPDASRVLVRNDMLYGYNGTINPNIATNLIDFVKETGGYGYMFVYGIGDHGGGPTRCDLMKIMEMSAWPVFPKIKFATARSFFEALESESPDLPVLDCELNTENTGCYTSQSLIKKANRYSENRLADAEYSASIAWKIGGRRYPHEKLVKSWLDCLFNHFHDILPGSGVRDTRHYTMGLFQKIMADTSMIETMSLRRLASMVDTSLPRSEDTPRPVLPPIFYKDAFGAGVGIGAGNGNLSTAEQSAGSGIRPFVIFNPIAMDREEVVEVMVWDNPVPGDETPFKNRSFVARSPRGESIPAQFISNGHEWGHNYIKVAFPAKVSGYGYSLYTLNEAEAEKTGSKLKLLQPPYHCSYMTREKSARFGCENEQIMLEINPRTGGILRLRDKRAKQDIISPGCQVPMLEYAVERPHGMSSWQMDFHDKTEALKILSIAYVASGPYKIGIQVKSEINNSRLTVTYEMEQNSPQIAIHIKGTWLEIAGEKTGCPTLRMPFALDLDSVNASYEIPFGALGRDLRNDEEVPALQWARVSGIKNKKRAGCLLLNDCKHGHALDGNVLRISLIRGSYDPDPSPELGEHEIHLALVPFSGKLTDAESAGYGRKLNHRLRIVGTDIHPGALPASGQFIKLSAGNIIVSGLKKAEDDNALIIRFYEIEGKKTKFKVNFDKTFGTLKKASLVDLMEREINTAGPRIASGQVALEAPAYGIVSAKMWF